MFQWLKNGCRMGLSVSNRVKGSVQEVHGDTTAQGFKPCIPVLETTLLRLSVCVCVHTFGAWVVG